jgi:AbrB family looped-hinge helix DNA binding protein
MRASTTITTKGQVVIPKVVRDKLGWGPGTRLHVETLPDAAIRVSPMDTTQEFEEILARLTGCMADSPGDPIASQEAEHRAELAAEQRGRRRA